jgi:hypothetical protein
MSPIPQVRGIAVSYSMGPFDILPRLSIQRRTDLDIEDTADLQLFPPLSQDVDHPTIHRNSHFSPLGGGGTAQASHLSSCIHNIY